MDAHERQEHWRHMREEFEREGMDEAISLMKECPPATAGPGPVMAPPREHIPKERLDQLADRIFGDIRIPQLRPLHWERPYWEKP